MCEGTETPGVAVVTRHLGRETGLRCAICAASCTQAAAGRQEGGVPRGRASRRFPCEMPEYLRHTSRFRAHACALMRLRCCSTLLKRLPLARSTLGRPPCPTAPNARATAHHGPFDCDATAHLRGIGGVWYSLHSSASSTQLHLLHSTHRRMLLATQAHPPCAVSHWRLPT